MADGPGFVPRRLRGKGPGNGRGKAGSGICGNGQGPQLPGSCMGGQHIRERTAHPPNPADCPAPPSPRGRHGVPVGIRPRDASRTERVLAAAATAKNLSTAAVPSVGPGTDGVARESCSLWEQVRRFEELPTSVPSLLASHSAVHNLEQDLLSICQEGEDEVLPHPSTSAGEAAGASVSSVVNTGCLLEQVRRFQELQTASEGGSV